ncbi:DUF504 domain-containing protein [Candidatus Woesearchaeota archaeon]|nr:DUF504 domain-containing protein [Candidatus Woesearchaeota archaeon]
MPLSETDKQFLMSLVYAAGIILFWRGIWAIADITPIVMNGFVSFFLGLLILTLTGYIYKEFDPFGQRTNKIIKLLHHITTTKKEEGYSIHYYDEVGKHHHKILPENIMRIEHNLLITQHKGHEIFIPIHRISRIHKKAEVIWKK